MVIFIGKIIKKHEKKLFFYGKTLETHEKVV